ncbi:HAD family hydrolase [Paracoccus yeei]|uniref:Haloacid dehalogenase-like hydrolase n=1 Tax=Paracoccus yeei TaxID=147645 RepID=A0A5P2QZA2_9RHOB|nr:HAD family hydrolase [Paracoccus yeei]QEU10633.1 haloacid dehalogenase-like hydrolase [Paracoccus yeei]
MRLSGFALILALVAGPALAQDLPSWNDGPRKQAIVDFVTAATTEGGPGWIAPQDRIATFDNDGTLWAEQPLYFQGLFAIDRIQKLAARHPEWKLQQPFKGVLEGDLKAVAGSGGKGATEILAVTHAWMTADAFEGIVNDWIKTARHPKTGLPYDEMIYQPMVELMDYLRDNGFQTWIVSGGGIDFMRPWADDTYGIPPQQIVGSQIAEEYQIIDGKPEFMRKPEVFFVDDGAGKPVGIERHIGKRPVMAFGNSDGDYQMLEYVTAGDGPSLGMIVHHTDAKREFAYDRDSHIGKLDKAMTDAPDKGWLLIDMAQDWSRVYPDP